jgi:hypothetical protein
MQRGMQEMQEMQEMFCCPSIDTLYAPLIDSTFIFITHPKSDLLHLLHPEESGSRWTPFVLVRRPTVGSNPSTNYFESNPTMLGNASASIS